MNSDRLIEDKENLDYVKNIAAKYMRYVPDDRRGMVSNEDLISAACRGKSKEGSIVKCTFSYTFYSECEMLPERLRS